MARLDATKLTNVLELTNAITSSRRNLAPHHEDTVQIPIKPVPNQSSQLSNPSCKLSQVTQVYCQAFFHLCKICPIPSDFLFRVNVQTSLLRQMEGISKSQ